MSTPGDDDKPPKKDGEEEGKKKVKKKKGKKGEKKDKSGSAKKRKRESAKKEGDEKAAPAAESPAAPVEAAKKEEKTEKKEEKEKKEKPFKKRASDYSEEVKESIPKWTAEAKALASKLPDVLSKFLALEKKTRLANDVESTLQLCLAVLDLCFDLKEWKKLNDNISVLCKRRAQSIEKTVSGIIKKAYTYVDQTPDKETKLALIDTLRTVSAGKIVVELERARLTKILSEMKEAEGDVDKASEILQEVQIETVGSMDTREKAVFLLDQVRLCLATKDYIRVEIIAQKVSTDAFKEEKMQDLKLKHYQQMIAYYLHEEEYLQVCKSYMEIYNTPAVQADEKQWKANLAGAVFFAALSPHDHEVSEILNRLNADKRSESIPEAKVLLQEYVSNELAPWPLPHAALWKKQEKLSAVLENKESGKKVMDVLHKRVVQHNLRVMGQYFNQIPTKRLATLLNLNEDQTEEYLCEMVSSSQLYARIDRPAGVVTFTKSKAATEIVQAWAEDIGQLLGLVERTCNDINKENMMNKVRLDAAKKAAKKAGTAKKAE
eukprot:gb/GEZN01004969.1/.p1 GENE.gb/GEZN01004969.1/~~gb/GEZN01004969.1/.p1  ORF type:complete len:556 (-),score=150.13 gb/GEZN01004969.1/:202-1845(-)